jgi:hypothetical protein
VGDGPEQDGRAAPIRDRVGKLDAIVDHMTANRAELDDDRAGVVGLSGRWLEVAAKLDEYSPGLAEQARRLSETLIELEVALANMSDPVEIFIGSAGRTADSLRAIVD